jgi:hypothetical protein
VINPVTIQKYPLIKVSKVLLIKEDPKAALNRELG